MADRAAGDALAAEELARWFADEVVAAPYRQLDELHALGPRLVALDFDPMGYPVWTSARLGGRR